MGDDIRTAHMRLSPVLTVADCIWILFQLNAAIMQLLGKMLRAIRIIRCFCDFLPELANGRL